MQKHLDLRWTDLWGDSAIPRLQFVKDQFLSKALHPHTHEVHTQKCEPRQGGDELLQLRRSYFAKSKVTLMEEANTIKKGRLFQASL